MNPFKFWKSKSREEPEHPIRAEILVVEDELAEADFLCGLLRFQGALVTWAGNLAGALEILNGPKRFQLAFVDIGLPNGSGTEAIRLIKERRRATHVIVVTANLDKLPLVVGYGYISILMKPYTIASIREVLRSHRLPVAD